MTFYIFLRHSLPSWLCGFNLQVVQLVGRYWVFFLSHTAPGFQLWFYFHLCTWVIHWGLFMRLPWWTWVFPSEGQVWKWCSFLSHRGSGHTRYQGGWWLRQQEISCPRRVWQLELASMLQYSWLENQATVYRLTESDTTKVTLHAKTQDFFACFSSAPGKVEHEGCAAAWLVGTLAAPSV